MTSDREYRPHCVRSVLTTSVKILPYRPPARLIRANNTMCAWMRQSLLFFLVEDLIDAYQAMRSSLDVHESDEVITAFFASVKVLVTAGKKSVTRQIPSSIY